MKYYLYFKTNFHLTLVHNIYFVLCSINFFPNAMLTNINAVTYKFNQTAKLVPIVPKKCPSSWSWRQYHL